MSKKKGIQVHTHWGTFIAYAKSYFCEACKKDYPRNQNISYLNWECSECVKKSTPRVKQSLWMDCLHECIAAAKEDFLETVDFKDVDALVIKKSKAISYYELGEEE